MWMKPLKSSLFHTCVQPQPWRWTWTSESCIWPKTSWTVCRTRPSWGTCWSSTTTSRFWTWETITYWTQVWPLPLSVSWLVSCFSNSSFNPQCLLLLVSSGLAYICEGLKEQRKGLVTLVLWNNQLTHNGMGYLAAALVNTHTHARNCVAKVSMSKSTSLGLIQTKSNTTKQSEIANSFCPKTIHTNCSTQISL